VYQEVNPLKLQAPLCEFELSAAGRIQRRVRDPNWSPQFPDSSAGSPLEEGGTALDLNSSTAIRLTSLRLGARFWEMDESRGIVTVISVYL
jgi:hypothetical protein